MRHSIGIVEIFSTKTPKFLSPVELKKIETWQNFKKLPGASCFLANGFIYLLARAVSV